jgi:hypothetical protein
MRSRLLATALIVLTMLGTGTWHAGGDDPDFLAEQTGHDHSRHHESFRSPAAADTAGHCAICHWLQNFRASQVRDARVHHRPLAASRDTSRAVARVSQAALLDVPSRAPPAFHL